MRLLPHGLLRFSGCCARVEVQITLHTPPPFTGCFPGECCPSKPSCTKKRGFLSLTRPSMPPFFACKPSFDPEYSQIIPGAAWIRSKSGESFARKPGIQAHSSAMKVPGEQLLCTAATAFSVALSTNVSWISCLLHKSVLLCGVIPRFFPPTIAVCHDGTHLHADHARLSWLPFPLRPGEVRDPKGGSNPCGRILSDRAALSREFPRN